MSNPNYIKGRAAEYAIMRDREAKGFECTRGSGSHSSWDVIAYRIDRKPEMIQSKVTSKPSVAKKLLKDFKTNTTPSSFYYQTMSVRIKGTSKPEEVTV